MKITTYHHGIYLSLIFLLLSPQISIRVGAQSGWRPNQTTNMYPYSRFSSSLAIIISVLVTSIIFMVFFFIYIRYYAAPSSARAGPIVIRAVAATRGLDASVIESFPTFSYSEVKDHKIGKEALECAVCLNEFEDDETLRLIPKCDHVFHPECIDAWLGSHVTCPVCRADLVPRPGEHLVHHVSGPTGSMDEEDYVSDDTVERSNSRNDEVVLQIDDGNQRHIRPNLVNRNLSFQYPYGPSMPVGNRNLSFGNPNRMLRSWTMMPRMFGQSHSSGNTPVQPGEDVERFTLRLPSELRKKVIHRASLNRTKSFAIKSGQNNEDDKIGRTNREVKSDRWIFFTRALSMSLRSPRGVAETGESSGSTSKDSESRTLNKLRSFNCLEPRGADEAGLISGELVKPTV